MAQHAFSDCCADERKFADSSTKLGNSSLNNQGSDCSKFPEYHGVSQKVTDEEGCKGESG